jgi:hypothetical protein
MKKGPMDSSLMAGIWDKKFVSEFFYASGALFALGWEWYAGLCWF